MHRSNNSSHLDFALHCTITGHEMYTYFRFCLAKAKYRRDNGWQLGMLKEATCVSRQLSKHSGQTLG